MQQPAKYFLKRLNSTNLYASQILQKSHLREPFWIRTDHQFAGKGQGANTWTSEPGKNLTGSLAIFPDSYKVSDQFSLSKTFALASIGFLELFIDEPRIKWPNDLYAGDKKIGGILIETAILGEFIDYAIFGAGININQVEFPENIPNAVSISMLTRFSYDLTEMENLLLESFRNHYTRIENRKFEEINNMYISKLYRFNEFSFFRSNDNTFSAKIVGVTPYGHLMLQTKSGNIQAFDYQQVEYIM